MPRFVVLEHDHPALHWDLMLEHAGVLKTWRLAQFPLGPGQKCAARSVADHRMIYLDYEGPVSGNRGSVVRRDHGSYEMIEVDGQDDLIHLSLHGNLLCRPYVLRRLQDDDWTLEPLAT